MWFSIEVLDGCSSASLWSEAYGDNLIEAAFLTGASDWNWHRHDWGVVLELDLPDEVAWDAFRALPTVAAALDAVPDPVSGLIVYRGRGGSSSRPEPRKPRPLAGCGAAALPLPWELFIDDELFGPALPIERRQLLGTGRARVA